MVGTQKDGKSPPVPSFAERIRAVRPNQILGWAVGAIMTFLVVGILFGRTLYPFLNAIGLGWLYHAESGVYADCSKPENRFNPYCMPKKSGDEAWRGLKDSKGNPSGFSLH